MSQIGHIGNLWTPITLLEMITAEISFQIETVSASVCEESFIVQKIEYQAIFALKISNQLLFKKEWICELRRYGPNQFVRETIERLKRF